MPLMFVTNVLTKRFSFDQRRNYPSV